MNSRKEKQLPYLIDPLVCQLHRTDHQVLTSYQLLCSALTASWRRLILLRLAVKSLCSSRQAAITSWFDINAGSVAFVALVW